MPPGVPCCFLRDNHPLKNAVCVAVRGDSRMIDVTVEAGVVMSWRRMGKFKTRFSHGKDSYGRRLMCL